MSSDSLEKLYTHRFEESLEYRRKVWAVMVADFFQQFVDRGDTVLDLGCGYCMFINNVVAALAEQDGDGAAAGRHRAGQRHVVCPINSRTGELVVNRQ